MCVCLCVCACVCVRMSVSVRKEGRQKNGKQKGKKKWRKQRRKQGRKLKGQEALEYKRKERRQECGPSGREKAVKEKKVSLASGRKWRL